MDQLYLRNRHRCHQHYFLLVCNRCILFIFIPSSAASSVPPCPSQDDYAILPQNEQLLRCIVLVAVLCRCSGSCYLLCLLASGKRQSRSTLRFKALGYLSGRRQDPQEAADPYIHTTPGRQRLDVQGLRRIVRERF